MFASRATWTATCYRQHRALPQNFVSGRTSADSAKLESIAALRTTGSAGTFGTIVWSCDDRARLFLEEIGELLLGSNTGLGTRDVMDALPPARRDGRAPSVSRRRLLWAVAPAWRPSRAGIRNVYLVRDADCAISKPWPVGVLWLLHTVFVRCGNVPVLVCMT